MKRPSRVLGVNIKMNIEDIRREEWTWTRSEVVLCEVTS